MPGVNIWGMVFATGAFTVAVFLVKKLIKRWKFFALELAEAKEKGSQAPDCLPPTIATVVLVSMYFIVVTVGWSAMVKVTAKDSSSYVLPAQAEEQERLLKSVSPTREEISAARDEQRDQQFVRPHQKAVDSFDETLKREAEKIKDRNR